MKKEKVSRLLIWIYQTNWMFIYQKKYRCKIKSIKINWIKEENKDSDEHEDDQTRQIWSQSEEWLLHVGLQQLYQHSPKHSVSKRRKDLGSDVRRCSIKTLSKAAIKEFCLNKQGNQKRETCDEFEMLRST